MNQIIQSIPSQAYFSKKAANAKSDRQTAMFEGN